MEYNERIELYLSGCADIKTQYRTENALLHDASFLESFIEAVEQNLYAAPRNLAGAVMRLIPSGSAAVTVPVLSRKLCAAVCFCSAAAILLVTVSGFDRHIVEYVSAQSGKLGELIAFIQNFTLGG